MLVQMVAVGQDMRGEHARRARQAAHFHDQFVGRRAMMVSARITLIGDDLVADERLYPVGDGGGAGRSGHIGNSFTGRVVPAPCTARAAAPSRLFR